MKGTPRGRCLRLQSQAIGHPVKPTSQRRSPANCSGAAGKDEKRGLEHVFGILIMPEHAPANAQDERRVPLHQGCEGFVIRVYDEAVEQFRVGAKLPFRKRCANVLQQSVNSRIGHGDSPQRDRLPARSISAW